MSDSRATFEFKIVKYYHIYHVVCRREGSCDAFQLTLDDIANACYSIPKRKNEKNSWTISCEFMQVGHNICNITILENKKQVMMVKDHVYAFSIEPGQTFDRFTILKIENDVIKCLDDEGEIFTFTDEDISKIFISMLVVINSRKFSAEGVF